MRKALLEVKEYFALRLESYLTRVESEQGIGIERWRFLEIYENYSNQYPAIEILPAETRINYGSPDKPIIEGIEQFEIDADISVAGSNPESINNTVLGYESGIKKMVTDDETFSGSFLWVLIRGIPFSPLIKEAKSGAILKILTIGLIVKRSE